MDFVDAGNVRALLDGLGAEQGLAVDLVVDLIDSLDDKVRPAKTFADLPCSRIRFYPVASSHTVYQVILNEYFVYLVLYLYTTTWYKMSFLRIYQLLPRLQSLQGPW